MNVAKIEREVSQLKLEVDGKSDANLCHLNITSLPASLASVAHRLHELNVSQNALTDEDESLNVLTSLQRLECLDLSCNRLPRLRPSTMLQFTRLTKLRLESNLFTDEDDLPASLGALQSLSVLSLSANAFKSGAMPSFVGFLTRLSHLEIERCNLTSLDAIESGRHSQLRVLKVSHNRLIAFPRRLPGLSTVHLNSNQITSINGAYDCAESLEIVHLNANLIESIPSRVAVRLRRLVVFDVKENRLARLPCALAVHSDACSTSKQWPLIVATKNPFSKDEEMQRIWSARRVETHLAQDCWQRLATDASEAKAAACVLLLLSRLLLGPCISNNARVNGRGRYFQSVPDHLMFDIFASCLPHRYLSRLDIDCMRRIALYAVYYRPPYTEKLDFLQFIVFATDQ